MNTQYNNKIDAEIIELQERMGQLQQARESLTPDQRPVKWARLRTKFVNNEEVEIPYTCIENTQALLDHYGITVKYNEMSKDEEVEISGANFHFDTNRNAKLTWIINKAHHKGYDKQEIDEHVSYIANQNAYHPVRDWILSEKWDGKNRLLEYYATITSDTEMKELLMRRWAIMCVAAIFEPKGIRPQGVLTFEGGQGMGKTTWLERIVGNKEWVRDGQELKTTEKDSILDVLSRWIVELGEIQSTFSKSDIQSLKAFITKDLDRIRPAYAKKTNEYYRRTCFFGTVDEQKFLNDANGNRRFWTISVSDIDLNPSINRQQFWRQIYEHYLEGERWWLDREEVAQLNESNEAYMSINPLEEICEEHIECNEDGSQHTFEWVSATKICERLKFNKVTKVETNFVAKWLKKNDVRYRKNAKKFYVAIKPPIS
jgi:putative DNA primase/helicase